ncbi:HAD family hydrolase [Umezawaea sp. Da 62-37]|uniref:HAD family hydrolase n=1 Tax=Umezawaea sp. Da 62-37 TaxID=3075927 RepID=UPI0028F6CE77|nr:HAD family hydrolase [Umezawaea sp. Da 62-37]WNV84339.1 HAD family hydrolase [Umezawaea sp. Da 62-37]
MTNTLLLDVDGTLVDTNYHHAVAWLRAFRSVGLTVPAWRVHRAIGMGGDRLVEAVAGEHAEAEHGDELRKAWEQEFEPLLDEIRPLEGAHRLVTSAVSEHGLHVVLASSGKREHIEHYLDLLDIRDVITGFTTSEDAEDSKPAPDLLQVALSKVDTERAVVVGDSVWDCDAAKRTGLPVVALLTGGFGDAELRDHGASTVYEALDNLRADLADLPFATV